MTYLIITTAGVSIDTWLEGRCLYRDMVRVVETCKGLSVSIDAWLEG